LLILKGTVLLPNHHTFNKKKIINDPVYGFIALPHPIVYDLIQHKYVQRLRRIMQLGLSHLVYPGALHTRFHHAIGAMHLMSQAVHSIRRKGHDITEEEERAVLIAILLHDVGHGPFSHALEYDIVKGVTHEDISVFFMKKLAEEFGDDLERALLIFKNKYHKSFLYELVSSQLDMDRLDYLNRDSFYTGVSEGVIGSERLIEMLDVRNGHLVLEEKGIYSIEKFIVARRLMYWQVYLHKTVVSAEYMLIHTIRRARKLLQNGCELFGSPTLLYFLSHYIDKEQFINDSVCLEHFADLDDFDIWGAIKAWQQHPDFVLSDLSRRLINRELFKIEISKEPFGLERINLEKELARKTYNLPEVALDYYVFSNVLTNNAYNQHKQNINMLMKNGEVIDVSKASDNLNISALASPVEKYFLCFPAY
jgi:HD superfamily phosphohydrolase